jgi:hypothetical protein
MKQTFRQYITRCRGEYRRCLGLTTSPAISAINLAAGEGITWGMAWKAFNMLKSTYGATDTWRCPAGDALFYTLPKH